LKTGHERALAELRNEKESLEKKHREKENIVQSLGATNRQLQMELANGKKEMQKLNADLVTAR
jgi:predicted RNase H-like nuclease (RuvC/YqgF family)